VILAGTLGSYVGSALSYFVARALGLPFIHRYGKYFFLSEEKIITLKSWVAQFGSPGIFASRFLPVVRHLISIPAGILEMSFARFSAATLAGAGLWCAVLAWFGQQVIGSHPELLDSPEAMMSVMKAKLHWIVGAVLALGILYALVQVALAQTREKKRLA
jgi:membrane protein DedA with SNARE-associated domain